MTGFDKNWNNQSKVSASEKLKESLRPQGPLKPRIETAVNKLHLQTSKLDTMIGKLNEKDAALFRRVVEATQRHDADAAKALSNELAEVRKISRTLNSAKMALEQVQMRLSTVHDLGDAMVALGPAMASIKGLKSGLAQFLPGADGELGNMQNMLNGVMMESLQGSSANIEMNTGSGADIDQIMMEASAVAEQKVNDRFPSIPSASYNLSEEHQQ
jgi:division protein CdvB (Snf7/Vps24/ESCRT-III family)